jgi:hypothetical protein
MARSDNQGNAIEDRIVHSHLAIEAIETVTVALDLEAV